MTKKKIEIDYPEIGDAIKRPLIKSFKIEKMDDDWIYFSNGQSCRIENFLHDWKFDGCSWISKF